MIDNTTTTKPAASSAPSTKQSAEADNAVAAVQQAIDVGELRVFDPAGPKFPLEATFYDRVIARPDIAKRLLEQELLSENVIERCNAYDFIAQFASSSVQREWAIDLLTKAGRDKSGMVRTFTRNALEMMERPGTQLSTRSGSQTR
jgi:hypothetical protein